MTTIRRGSVHALLAAACLLSTAVSAQKPGATLKDCETCPELVVVPGGRFVMGVPRGEEARHGVDPSNRGRSEPMTEVNVRSFAIGRFEVTRGQFTRFVAETKYSFPDNRGCWGYYGIPAAATANPRRAVGRSDLEPALNWRSPGYRQEDNHPVVCVAWIDIRAYLSWLSTKSGFTYRLPSEAEWEYTARAGTTTARPWGDDNESACKHANVSDRSRVRAHGMKDSSPDNLFPCNDGFPGTSPVGKFPPNRFGVYDLIGNVWEVTEDCFEYNLKNIPRDGSPRVIEHPLKPDAPRCEERVSKGGSFDLFPWFVRTGYRSRFQVFTGPSGTIRLSNEGFRVARSLQ